MMEKPLPMNRERGVQAVRQLRATDSSSTRRTAGFFLAGGRIMAKNIP